MKRFTETEKWRDPWFRRLTPAQKCLWQYLCDSCDAAGVIDLDIEMASFQIGVQLTAEDVLALGERIETLSTGKLVLVKFIAFQYGQLSSSCPAHKPVFKALAQNGIPYPKDRDTERVTSRDTESLQDKYKDKDKDKEGGPGEISPPPCTADEAKANAKIQGFEPWEGERWWHARNAVDWRKADGAGGLRHVGRAGWASDLRSYVQRMRGSPDWKPSSTPKAQLPPSKRY